MRPEGLHITRRFYRGRIDTPKSHKSVRVAAVSASIRLDLEAWRARSSPNKQDDWIFPGKSGDLPLWPTTFWKDKIRPTLIELNLEWVNYQVLRRSAATLMNQAGIDGQVVATQLGHGLDVSQNIYNKIGVARQQDAVNALEEARHGAKPESDSSQLVFGF